MYESETLSTSSIHINEPQLRFLIHMALLVDVAQSNLDASGSLQPTALLVQRPSVEGTLQPARRGGYDAVDDLGRVAVG